MAGKLDRTSIDPLETLSPITNPDGTPTDDFARRWLQQRTANTATEQQVAAALAAAAAAEAAAATATAAAIAAQSAVAALAAIEIGGDGDIEPAPAAIGDGDITLGLSDTGVAPDTYGDATNVPQITVDEKGRVTSVTEVPISGGGGGTIDFEDDGTPIVAAGTVNFTGAGVTVTDVAGVATVNIPGGGGGGGGVWELVGATAITSPVATVDFTGLGGYTELMFEFDAVGTVGSGGRGLQFSVNGGASYFSGASDYQRLTGPGSTTSSSFALMNTTSTGVDVTAIGVLRANIDGVKKYLDTPARDFPTQFAASTDVIDAVRFMTSTGDNMDSGVVRVYGRA